MVSAGDKIRAADIPDVTYPLIHRVAWAQEGSDSSAITTVETVVGTLTFNAVDTARYETVWNLKCVQSVSTDVFLFSIREDSVSGTSLDAWAFTTGNTGSGVMKSWQLDWVAAATGSKTLVCTLKRSSGTGNIARAGKSNYQINRVS